MLNDSHPINQMSKTPFSWLSMAGASEPPFPSKRQVCYDYPRPAYTADTVVFNGASVLLIRRGKEPFKGMLALPGGFVNEGESSSDAARRELLEETGLVTNSVPKLVGIYDEPGRDPRGWVISAVFCCRTNNNKILAGDDATEAIWVNMDQIHDLAFDHQNIINDAWNYENL